MRGNQVRNYAAELAARYHQGIISKHSVLMALKRLAANTNNLDDAVWLRPLIERIERPAASETQRQLLM